MKTKFPIERYAQFLVAVLFAAFVNPTAMAQTYSSDLFSAATAPASAESALSSRPEVLRERPVTIHFETLNAAIVSTPAAAGDADIDVINQSTGSTQVVLNLFADVQLPVLFDRTEGNASGSRTWIGHIEGIPYSSVTLVIKNGIMTGNIAVDDRIYQVGFAGNGVHMVREIDQSIYPPEAEPGRVDNVRDAPSSMIPETLDSTSSEGDATVLDGRATIKSMDVLVVYTTAAKNVQGGQTAIENLIDTAIAESNTGYANSGINQRLNLVHTAEVTYTESGDIQTDRDRLQNPSDGFMDNVASLRDTYHADLVTLIVDNGGGYCGIAYIMETVALTFQDHAFNVVADECATGYYSFAHELGHIMSARHDWYVDPTNLSPYSYNHAYVNETVLRRSVMAYNNDCADSGVYCTRLNWWSNPDAGPFSPWGIREGTSTTCAAGVDNPGCDADNRKTLNNTASTVANFRVRDDVVGASRPFDSTAAPNNGNAGVMFDLKAKKTTTIHGFSSVFSPAATAPRIEIYYREGSYIGHDTDASAWKLAGSANNVAVQASPAQTHIPIDLDITIPAGQTFAFYITTPDLTTYPRYRNGTTEGALFAADDALELLEGRGKSYPFGGSSFPRVFSGTVYHSYASERDLLTTNEPNNQQNGVMFDIRAKSTVTIHGFSSYVENLAGTSGWVDGMEVYYRPGTHVGFENSATGWTQLGPVHNVVSSNVFGSPVAVQNRVPIQASVTIPAGQTYAFYVTTDTSGWLGYRNGTGIGNVYASDPNIEVLEGTGKAYPFGGSFTPRVFAGTIHYEGAGWNDHIGVWRPSSHAFYLDADGSNSWTGGDVATPPFGLGADLPIIGDWNGDGSDQIGVFRPSNGRFFLDVDGSYTWTAGDVATAPFGLSTDRPVIGDWNGDGTDDIGVFRPSTGRFYLDADGSYSWSAGDVVSATFGLSTDQPVVGDWDGSGTGDIGVFRPSTGRFYLDADGSYSWNTGDIVTSPFGLSTDRPVVGDWDGNGNQQIGVFRPSTGRFYLDADGSYSWNAGDVVTAPFGLSTDLPVAGQW